MDKAYLRAPAIDAAARCIRRGASGVTAHGPRRRPCRGRLAADLFLLEPDRRARLA
jgi:hypothetical protein